MNALMLALAVRLSGGQIAPLRVLLGAAVGAAIAYAAKGIPRMGSVLMWLPAAMLMMRIARGKGGRMLADALLLLCAAGLVGGMVLALWGATGSLFLSYALGGAASAVIGVCTVWRRGAALPVARARVICAYGGKTAVFDAMIDSGNTLRDYLTHLPVIVLAERSAKEALDLTDQLLRPIFAQTAGGRQKMYVLAPERVTLDLDGAQRDVRAVIALSPQMSPDVPALVPASLSIWKSNGGG